MIADFIGTRTMRDLVLEQAALHPDKPCLVHEDPSGNIRQLTYGEFLESVQRTAAGFASIGISKGDSVVVHLNNCLEFVTSWFGLAWLGAVMVPSNTASTASEMDHILNHS